MRRLSGTLTNRPAARAARGARYYATDEETVFFSTGSDWLPDVPLDEDQIVGQLSGSGLSNRPNPASCIGYVFTDTSNNQQYEAFPGGWALIRDLDDAGVPPGGDSPQIAAGVLTANLDCELGSGAIPREIEIIFADYGYNNFPDENYAFNISFLVDGDEFIAMSAHYSLLDINVFAQQIEKTPEKIRLKVFSTVRLNLSESWVLSPQGRQITFHCQWQAVEYPAPPSVGSGS